MIYNVGKWGYICPDIMNQALGDVICRDVGYSRASKVSSNRFPQYLYFLIYPKCNGQESHLAQCGSGGFYTTFRYCSYRLIVTCVGKSAC